MQKVDGLKNKNFFKKFFNSKKANSSNKANKQKLRIND